MGADHFKSLPVPEKVRRRALERNTQRHEATLGEMKSRHLSGLCFVWRRLVARESAVETSVNRWVAGSSSARGANLLCGFQQILCKRDRACVTNPSPANLCLDTVGSAFPRGAARASDRPVREPDPDEHFGILVRDHRDARIVSLERLTSARSVGTRILGQNAPQHQEQGMIWDNQQDSFYDPARRKAARLAARSGGRAVRARDPRATVARTMAARIQRAADRGMLNAE